MLTRLTGFTGLTVIVLGVLLGAGVAAAGPVTLAWDNPTELEDGALIPVELRADLVTRIYAARQAPTLVWELIGTFPGGAETGTIELPAGNWAVRATAAFPEGAESDGSATAQKKIYPAVRTKTVGKLVFVVVPK